MKMVARVHDVTCGLLFSEEANAERYPFISYEDRAIQRGVGWDERGGGGNRPDRSEYASGRSSRPGHLSFLAAHTASFSRKIFELWRMSTGNAGWKRIVE